MYPIFRSARAFFDRRNHFRPFIVRLPLKTEYACQIMAQLARFQRSGEVRRVEELAEAEGLSPNYLVQILTQLRPAGLVISRRGKYGGYLLAREPESITLAEIAQAMEGQDLIWTSPGNGGMSALRVREAWKRANDDLYLALTQITLADLIPDVDANPSGPGDWVI